MNRGRILKFKKGISKKEGGVLNKVSFSQIRSYKMGQREYYFIWCHLSLTHKCKNNKDPFTTTSFDATLMSYTWLTC
jgi:hypothetical protein